MLHVHIPYGIKVDVDGNKQPLFAGWFEHEVPLPFDGTIPNPMYCPLAASYLHDFWLKQPAYWAMTLVELLRKGLGMVLSASNQLSEAVFLHTKSQKDLQENCAEPAMYLHHWWKQYIEDLQNFVKESEAAEHTIANRQTKKMIKEAAKTADAIENDKYNQNSTDWGTGKKNHKHEEKVRRQMEFIFHTLGVTKSSAAKRNTLVTFHNNMPKEKKIGSMSGMADSTWHTFISGNRPKNSRVNNENMLLFEAFVDAKNKELGLEVLNG